jgi:alpha-L-fucosidase
MRDAKFGIYCHWGVYSVPDYDSEHYEHRMYDDSDYTKYGTHQRQIAIYGPLEKFGYHNFIPMFTAERFDAAQWADIFHKAGARFAGPVAEHEDGFSMWDSLVTPFNAKAMGPRRDVVGELERAIRARGLKFFTSMHNGVNYTNVKMKPTWAGAGIKYAKLYGSTMERDRWLAMWQAKAIEVADRYLPDVMYHDVGLDTIPDLYKERYIAHYFNLAAADGREVIVTYKKRDIPPGIGMLDHESSHPKEIVAEPWLCDYTIGTGLSPSWSYTDLIELRTPSEILHTLIEVVANNGQMLLNLSPRASGEIPEDQRKVVLKVGEWLWSFGESIYATRPSAVASETLENGQQVFYTRKGRSLYIIVLSWPGKGATLKLRELTLGRLGTRVASAHLFGLRKLEPCTFVSDASGVQVTLPADTGQPSELASVIRLEFETDAYESQTNPRTK